jgi:coatomer subunit beta
MLKSESQAVTYEAAWTLVSLSTAPTAVRFSAQAYAQLLNNSSDNNVKLIVLDRLCEMKKFHSKIVQELLMDILRVLSSPNIYICKKALEVAIDLVGPKNIEEVIALLKREVIKTQENDIESGEEYKNLLIQAIHKCATKFAEVADSVVLVLLDFVGGDAGYNVLVCAKSIVEQYPHFRTSILRKIIDNLDEIDNAEACRVSLWLLSEYANYGNEGDDNMVNDAFEAIRNLIGEPPFIAPLVGDSESKKKIEEASVSSSMTKNVVLSDGTYASVTSVSAPPRSNVVGKVPHLRRLICEGDILLGTVAATSLSKLALKSSLNQNRLFIESLLVVAGIGRLIESKKGNRIGVNSDCLDRLRLCSRLLLDPSLRSQMLPAFCEATQIAYSLLAKKQKAAKLRAAETSQKSRASNPDDLIQFRQLRAFAVQRGLDLDLMDADDISRAVGAEGSNFEDTKLRHIYQLTGYSDPVYAEASLTVHEYDIVVEMLIVNRTSNTLTNLTVELATIGDLKILERPQSYNIAPLDERRLKTNIKVSSTETGHIFGTIVFETSSSAQKVYINLADIQLDIMDYIRPAECRQEEFRNMWAEFEWENKVAVNTNINDLKDYLNHIIKSTNMNCLTPFDDKLVRF